MSVCLCGVKQDSQDVYNLLVKAAKRKLFLFPLAPVFPVVSLLMDSQPALGAQGRDWWLLWAP